jgi:hypothetical protein
MQSLASSRPSINASQWEGMTGREVRESFLEKENKIPCKSPALVAHTCNSSYSGGRYQEDHGSKPAPDK